MPAITVCGIITDGERVFLARLAGSGHWLLPGGLLADTDETVEDALVRALRDAAGVSVVAQEFLDTLYERRGDEVVVHNIFMVTEIAGELPDEGERGGAELRWAMLDALDGLPLAPWLGEALPALLAGEPAPGPQIDTAAITAAVIRQSEGRPARNDGGGSRPE
jgi:ADP-ribose pyrophosphatase YjhB (NUDIX family)